MFVVGCCSVTNQVESKPPMYNYDDTDESIEKFQAEDICWYKEMASIHQRRAADASDHARWTYWCNNSAERTIKWQQIAAMDYVVARRTYRIYLIERRRFMEKYGYDPN